MQSAFEEENVVNIYSKIASHFNDTRFNQWDWITQFIGEINESSKNNEKQHRVLDIGCGNGRNMKGFNKNVVVYGIDNCKEFIEICIKNNRNVVECDMTHIPFPDKYFNYFLCIASFHHLSSEKRRKEALHEIHRVSKPGTIMLLSIWSINQPKNTKQYKNITKYGDIFVHWNNYGIIYERYYYIFKLEEIRRLFRETGWVIENHWWDYGNEIFRVRSVVQ